jgi:hypothetical protein
MRGLNMTAIIRKTKKAISPDTEAAATTICLPDRDARIAEIAYHKAECRGFEPGHEVEDWLEAEQEFML